MKQPYKTIIDKKILDTEIEIFELQTKFDCPKCSQCIQYLIEPKLLHDKLLQQNIHWLPNPHSDFNTDPYPQ